MKLIPCFAYTILLFSFEACSNNPKSAVNDTVAVDSLKMSPADSALQAFKKEILRSVDEPDLSLNKTEVIRLICMRNADDKNENNPGHFSYRVYRYESNQYILTIKNNPEPENRALIKTKNISISEQQYRTLLKLAENDSLWVSSPANTGILNTSHETLILEYVDSKDKRYHLTMEQGNGNKYVNQIADSLKSFMR